MVECKIELTFVKLGTAYYGMGRGKMEQTYAKLGAAYYGMCRARPSDTKIYNIEISAVRTTRWARSRSPIILVGECSAFLASGSDPTVLCTK